jgi:hypothetical protein
LGSAGFRSGADDGIGDAVTGSASATGTSDVGSNAGDVSATGLATTGDQANSDAGLSGAGTPTDNVPSNLHSTAQEAAAQAAAQFAGANSITGQGGDFNSMNTGPAPTGLLGSGSGISQDSATADYGDPGYSGYSPTA